MSNEIVVLDQRSNDNSEVAMVAQGSLTDTDMTSWQKFRGTLRSRGGTLLRRLDEFPKSVLVAGCQRSGTTMLARVLSQSEGMVNYWSGPDDELDAALILSGCVRYSANGRHCFQTTYLNERYREYFDHHDYRLVWVLRNPYSVVHSMLFNWREPSLNELFRTCGASWHGGLSGRFDRMLGLRGMHRLARTVFGIREVRRLHRACSAYNGKVSQVFELRRHLGPDRMMIIEYDHLVRDPLVVLPQIYRFIDLPFRPEYCERIHPASLSKKDGLSKGEARAVRRLCEPTYLKAVELVTIPLAT